MWCDSVSPEKSFVVPGEPGWLCQTLRVHTHTDISPLHSEYTLVRKFNTWRLTEMTVGHRCNTVKQGWGGRTGGGRGTLDMITATKE